jgi:Ca2+-binding EF-hand superfamily protein
MSMMMAKVSLSLTISILLCDFLSLKFMSPFLVCQLDFITFMLLAMQKVDKTTMKDLKSLFKALDAGKTGFIEKEDLILLRQRKRLAKRLRREARNRKRLYETGYPKIENGETYPKKHAYDQLKGYRIK